MAKCKICGREFTLKTPFQKCCSAECSEENKRQLSREREAGLRAAIKALDKAVPVIYKKTCVRCGCEFTATVPTKQYCSKECLLLARQARNAEQRRRLQQPKKPARVSEINEIARQAAECNLDYGTYRGFLNMGKTYEELKALAPLRNPPVHQHTPHRER